MALRTDGQRRCDWCIRPYAPNQLLPIIAVWRYRAGDEVQGNDTNLVCGDCWARLNKTIRRWKDRAWKDLPASEKDAILHGDIAVPPLDT